MEKAVTVIGKAAAGSVSRDQAARETSVDRRDHLKVWREIYQDVRRQWAEAENYRHKSGRYER